MSDDDKTTPVAALKMPPEPKAPAPAPSEISILRTAMARRAQMEAAMAKPRRR